MSITITFYLLMSKHSLFILNVLGGLLYLHSILLMILLEDSVFCEMLLHFIPFPNEEAIVLLPFEFLKFCFVLKSP